MTGPDDAGRLAQRLRDAAAALAALAPAVAAGRPWPLSDDVGHTPESRWGPPETLAHVAEMLPFWTGELERVLDAPSHDDPVPFGRVATDPVRIALVERDRSLPTRELFARIDSGAERLARRLETLPPAAMARRGIHPTLGEMPMDELAQRFAVGHLEEHLEQLRELLPEA